MFKNCDKIRILKLKLHKDLRPTFLEAIRESSLAGDYMDF